MTTHYKKPLDFTDKIVEDASKAIQKFRSLLEEKDDIEPIECMEIVEALNDDLNTPLAISIMHKLASENKLAELKFACEFLGLEIGAVDIPSDIVDLAEKRNQYKLERNWKMADEMRDAILEKGFEIKDSKDGYKIEKSKTAKIARQNTMSM